MPLFRLRLFILYQAPHNRALALACGAFIKLLLLVVAEKVVKVGLVVVVFYKFFGVDSILSPRHLYGHIGSQTGTAPKIVFKWHFDQYVDCTTLRYFDQYVNCTTLRHFDQYVDCTTLRHFDQCVDCTTLRHFDQYVHCTTF